MSIPTVQVREKMNTGQAKLVNCSRMGTNFEVKVPVGHCGWVRILTPELGIAQNSPASLLNMPQYCLNLISRPHRKTSHLKIRRRFDFLAKYKLRHWSKQWAAQRSDDPCFCPGSVSKIFAAALKSKRRRTPVWEFTLKSKQHSF